MYVFIQMQTRVAASSQTRHLMMSSLPCSLFPLLSSPRPSATTHKNAKTQNTKHPSHTKKGLLTALSLPATRANPEHITCRLELEKLDRARDQKHTIHCTVYRIHGIHMSKQKVVEKEKTKVPTMCMAFEFLNHIS